jgi:hypothetical protein
MNSEAEPYRGTGGLVVCATIERQTGGVLTIAARGCPFAGGADKMITALEGLIMSLFRADRPTKHQVAHSTARRSGHNLFLAHFAALSQPLTRREGSHSRSFSFANEHQRHSGPLGVDPFAPRYANGHEMRNRAPLGCDVGFNGAPTLPSLESFNPLESLIGELREQLSIQTVPGENLVPAIRAKIEQYKVFLHSYQLSEAVYREALLDYLVLWERALAYTLLAPSASTLVAEEIAALGYEYDDINGDYYYRGTPGWFKIQYRKLHAGYTLKEYAYVAKRIGELKKIDGFKSCGLKSDFLELLEMCKQQMR